MPLLIPFSSNIFLPLVQAFVLPTFPSLSYFYHNDGPPPLRQSLLFTLPTGITHVEYIHFPRHVIYTAGNRLPTQIKGVLHHIPRTLCVNNSFHLYILRRPTSPCTCAYIITRRLD